MELFIVTIGMIVLAAFATMANEIGVDSRDLSDDSRRPAYPVGIA